MITSYLKIDGVNMPEPGTFSVGGTDLDGENTARLENGNMQRDVIGYAWRQPSCTWNAIPQAESQLLLCAIDKEDFTVEYTDPKEGLVTKTCYAGPWTAEQIPKSMSKAGGPWWNVAFDITEAQR